MVKKILVILCTFGIFSALMSPIAVSQTKPVVIFGWDTLDYGKPRFNSSYFNGIGSKASNGSLYQGVLETLPYCKTLIELAVEVTDCIESLEARVANNDWVVGKLVRYQPVRWQPRYIKISDAASNIVEFSDAKIDLPADSIANTFTGSRGAIWTFDGIKHDIGNEFLYFADAYGVAIDGRVDWNQGFLKSNLYPVSVSDVKNVQNPTFPNVPIYSRDDSGTCVIDSTRRFCVKQSKFPADIRFRVTLKLNKAGASISSDRWFITRTTNPALTITPSGVDQTFVFEGEPVSVQVPTISLPREEVPMREFVKSWYSSLNKGSPDLEVEIERGVPYHLNSTGSISNSNSTGSTKVFAGWEPFMKYATLKELSGWTFTNESDSLTPALSRCPKSARYPGLVASNSTAVEPGPPTYNNTDESLEYRVAAPHLTENGAKNVGTYSLYVSSDIAKCLWGDNLNSAKASVSILNDDGSVQVAAAVLKSDSNGLTFQVSGFHYSTGVIKISLMERDSTPSPTSPGTPVPATESKVVSRKKTTITCIKVKVTKKVTAVKPLCPKGYKKK
jgi:hypothetical protein